MRKHIESGIRERVISVSIQLFSDKGFHGTSMRDIAQGADCSLPMLYYYFQNKQILYEAIAYDEFLRMHDMLNQSLPFIGSLPEFYQAFLKSRSSLSPRQKSLYKLALKTLYAFEDLPELTSKMQQWEQERESFNKKLIAKYNGTSQQVEVLSSVLYHTIENITIKLILQDCVILEEQINAEIDFIFKAMCDNLNGITNTAIER